MTAAAPLRRIVLAALACLGLTTLAGAETLNGFRAAHGLPLLAADARLAGLAQSHAYSMARRNSLDHDGFLQRAMLNDGASAENVAYGCATEACAMRMWANSSGHRANMLRTDIERYGLASATAADGRKYWALELAGSGGGRVIHVRGGRAAALFAAPVAGPFGRDLGIGR